MLEAERERNEKMLQMWQERTHCQRLQRKVISEETEDLKGNRWQKEEHKIGFWRRSWVGIVWEISLIKSYNKYIIPNWWSSIERELNVRANMKTKNGKNLKVKTLVDSGCIHIGIDK